MLMRERTLIGDTPVDIPEVIPPRSIVALRTADRSTPAWKNEIGRTFRIGYYRRKDGLDCIWLVNERGEYEQTTDRQTLLRFFSIEKLSRERDYYGDSRPQLRAGKIPGSDSRRRKKSRSA